MELTEYILCVCSVFLLTKNIDVTLGDQNKDIVKSSDKFVVCYYGSWSYWRNGDGHFKPSDIDPLLCTHVIYSFAKLNNITWTIESADPWLDLPPPSGGLNGYGEFVKLKDINPDLKAMIAIGGWNDGSKNYSIMASDPVKRETFVQSAVSFVKQYNFDGLDLDWEYPANRGGEPEDKENFPLLVEELKTEFIKYGLLVTAAIGVGTDILETAYNFPALCEHLDFFNLMMYDLHGYFDGFTGHHTSMFNHPNLGENGNSLTDALNNIIDLGGCTDKMVLGMGMYARTSTLSDPTNTAIGATVSGPGTPGDLTLDPNGSQGYNEICLLEGYSTERDNYTMAPWSYKGDQWLSYDDVESIQYKSNWALDNGLLGGMIWSIETDDFKNNCGDGAFPLLSEIFRIMSSVVVTTTEITTKPATTKPATTNPSTTELITSEPTTSDFTTIITTTITGRPTEPTSKTTTATTNEPTSSSATTKEPTSLAATTKEPEITTSTMETTENIDDGDSLLGIYILSGFTVGVIGLIFLIYLIRTWPAKNPILV